MTSSASSPVDRSPSRRTVPGRKLPAAAVQRAICALHHLRTISSRSGSPGTTVRASSRASNVCGGTCRKKWWTYTPAASTAPKISSAYPGSTSVIGASTGRP